MSLKPDDVGPRDLIDAVGSFEARPRDFVVQSSLTSVLSAQNHSIAAVLVTQAAAIVRGFSTEESEGAAATPTAPTTPSVTMLAERAAADFQRALDVVKSKPLVDPSRPLSSPGLPNKVGPDHPLAATGEAVSVESLAPLVQALHEGLSAWSPTTATVALNDAFAALDRELRRLRRRREAESPISRVAWCVRDLLKDWLSEVEGWTIGPFGSANLLGAIAHGADTGLGPYFRGLPPLVHDADDLLALARLWTRDADDNFVSLEKACVLVAQNVRPRLRNDFIEELGNFRLLVAIATLDLIEEALPAEVDRIFLFRVRDAYLDGDQPTWAVDVQQRICDRWPDNADEFIVLGEIALAANRRDIAETAYRRALNVHPRHSGARARLDQIASGQVPEVASQGFGTPVQVRNRRALLKSDDAMRKAYLDRLIATGESIVDQSGGVTREIIRASDHHWYDIAYYASLGKIDRLMTRKKRAVKTIALYYWRLHDGGTERVTSRLAAMWRALGYRVLLLTDEQPSAIDYDCGPDIERFVLPAHRERYIERGNALVKLFRTEDVDVFISNLWVETATSWDVFIAKSMNIPAIVGWHNVFDAGIYDGHDIGFFRQRLAAYRHADLVIALSTMDQYWFSIQGIASRLIHNPLTFQTMPATVSPLSSRKIIWIGRVEQHQKRVEHVIRILPLVLERVPDATLIVVGNGPDKPSSERLAKSLGVANRIKFVGYSSKVEEFIKQAAVHVMTSEFEGSPMVISETWSYGVPTVMYDLAFLEFLREGKGFVSVDQLDYESLAQEVSRVLLDDPLRQRLGREARATAQAFFDIDVAAEWKRVFDDLGTKDDMAGPLTPQDVAAVAPLLARHLADRMYTVDERAGRALQSARPSGEGPREKHAHHHARGGFGLLGGLAGIVSRRARDASRAAWRWIVKAGAKAFDRRPSLVFSKLKTIDFAHIGLGDNLMAWVGLHALLSNGHQVAEKGCDLYVPADLAELAVAIFARYDLRVTGVAPHTSVRHVSPVFSPLPPESLLDWYKTYIGVDWRMNCFEALDTQKSIPRANARSDEESRFRLGLSERILYRRSGWQAAGVDYIGYRLWLPIARKFGLMPVAYMALVKRGLAPLRGDIAAYVDERSAGKEPGPDMVIFPAGKSFQAFSPAATKALQDRLPKDGTAVYIQANDPWMAKYLAAGIEPHNLGSIADLLWIVKSSRRVMTTDSFSSHVAQMLRDDFVLALTRDFAENIVHPGAHPLIVANHPGCAPCNYVPRNEASECAAKYNNCIAFENPKFIENIARAMLAFPAIETASERPATIDRRGDTVQNGTEHAA